MTTTNSQAITKEIIDGVSYYSTMRRGVRYCAYICKSGGEWFVSTKRVAYSGFGGGKYYSDIAACKAFAALPTMIKMRAI